MINARKKEAAYFHLPFPFRFRTLVWRAVREPLSCGTATHVRVPFLTAKIVYDCTFLCSSFDFGFDRIWLKRHVTSNSITCLQSLGTMTSQHGCRASSHPRWRISNWPKTGLFLLITKANSHNLLCFPNLGA